MKKANFKFPIDPLEGWSAFAGLVVFIGLGFEIGPEAWGYVITRTLLPRELFGSALVAIGVFAEVALGIFIARSSKRQEIESNETIAELNAETERLRKENNETAILREYRSLKERAAFVEAMHPFSGTAFIIEAVPGDTEVTLFRMQLYGALREAGWIPRPWLSDHNSAVKHFGVTVLTVITPSHDEESEAARALGRRHPTDRT